MSGFKSSATYVLGLITIGIVVGIVLTTGFNLDSKSVAEPADDKIYLEGSSEQSGVNVANFNPNHMFVDMVKRVRPSIVSIYTTKSITMRDNPFFHFFRDMPQDDLHRQRKQKQKGLGSGIIISKDGYIITNNHVIEDVDELQVKLIDGTEYKAKIIGTDAATEIGLIKIDAKNLPVAILGNSETLQIGEWVMAIGNPLELTSTVTAGIVSALHRQIDIGRTRDGINTIENFIQTDAAINPGNSGGALINLKGEVIGINTAIASRTNYYMGYGFAVPINIAKSVVDDLKKYGEVKRGYLGVIIVLVDPVTAKGVGLDKPRGVFITSVIDGSAADEAGIEDGDVVFSVDGKEVNQPNELQAAVGTHNPGETVKLKIWRGGKTRTIKVTLQGQSTGLGNTGQEEKKEQTNDIADLGMEVRNLNQRQMDMYDVDGGVLVMSVVQDGPAAKARLSQGDVVLSLNGQSLESTKDFYDIISDLNGGDVVKLKLRSKQGTDLFDRLVFLQIPE